MTTENREIVSIEIVAHDDRPFDEVDSEAQQKWDLRFEQSEATGRDSLQFCGSRAHSPGSSFLVYRYEGTLIR